VPILVCQQQRATGSPINGSPRKLLVSNCKPTSMGSYPDSTKWLSRPPQPIANISSQHKNHTSLSIFGFSRGLGYTTEVVIQLALVNLINMIITARQFTSFIQITRQMKQINETDKLLMHRDLQMIQWTIASIK
jgi:hypothetical protein